MESNGVETSIGVVSHVVRQTSSAQLNRRGTHLCGQCNTIVQDWIGRYCTYMIIVFRLVNEPSVVTILQYCTNKHFTGQIWSNRRERVVYPAQSTSDLQTSFARQLVRHRTQKEQECRSNRPNPFLFALEHVHVRDAHCQRLDLTWVVQDPRKARSNQRGSAE